MKTFDLDELGVQEMDAREIKETDGGHPILWLIAGILFSEIVDRDRSKDFEDGYNAARKNSVIN